MLLVAPLVLATLALAAPSPPLRSPSANTGSILPLVFQVDPGTAFSRPAPIYATINEVDDARFGEACNYGGASSAYLPCGDFLQLSTGIDHALFCSPLGVCAGEMAACGSDDACDEGTSFWRSSRKDPADSPFKGLSCNANTHKCAVTGSYKVSANAARLDQRRKTASATCPELSEACPTGAGGFEVSSLPLLWSQSVC